MRASIALLLAGCTGSATVHLQFRNSAAASTSKPRALTVSPAVPSELAMRMIAVYLAEDVDPVTLNNIGQNTMIWLNEECGGSIGDCDIEGQPGYSNYVQSYFDFAQGVDAVNAILNAQGRAAEAGTYRYARIEFCKIGPDGGDPVEPNVEWSVAGLSAPRRFGTRMCGVTSQPFAAPLELKAGDTVTVTLAYDLSQTAATVDDDQPSGPGCIGGFTPADQTCYQDCVQTGDAVSGWSRTCVNVPVFTPSAAAAGSY